MPSRGTRRKRRPAATRRRPCYWLIFKQRGALRAIDRASKSVAEPRWCVCRYSAEWPFAGSGQRWQRWHAHLLLASIGPRTWTGKHSDSARRCPCFPGQPPPARVRPPTSPLPGGPRWNPPNSASSTLVSFASSSAMVQDEIFAWRTSKPTTRLSSFAGCIHHSLPESHDRLENGA